MSAASRQLPLSRLGLA